MLQGKAFVLLCGDGVLTCECDKAVLQHIMSLQLSGVAMHGMLEVKDAVVKCVGVPVAYCSMNLASSERKNLVSG